MFGSKKVFFLAIHLSPGGEEKSFGQDLQISYKLNVTKVEPANVQDLKALFNVATGGGVAAAAVPPANANLAAYQAFLKTLGSRPYDGLYGAARLTNLKNLPVQIVATMNATLPKAVASKNAGAHQETGFWDPPVPAPAAAAPAVGTQQSGCTTVAKGGPCPESLTVQNEGLYRWDVSIGIPFKTLNQLQYAYSSTGQVAPSTISKASAYGFVAVAPWKEDIISPPSLGIPHILIGVPITGKVLDSPFVGAGETFNVGKLPKVGATIGKVLPFGIRFYAGLVEYKEFGPKPATGTSGPPSRWLGKLQYGIEFSVRDIASKLTSAGKSATSQKNSSN
jgi:hypothetical protein